MTENPHVPQRNMRRLVWLVALAVAGCSSSAGSTAVHGASVTPAISTATSAPTVASPPMPASTPDSTPTVTVTVTPPPAPAPATVAVQSAASGPFHSPSGNINCTMFTSGGENTARCEVVAHIWVAPPRSPDCQLNWGDRFELTQGSPAAFNCYGQARSLGTITCESEYTGMTCTDSSTGHYFRVAREVYQLG